MSLEAMDTRALKARKGVTEDVLLWNKNFRCTSYMDSYRGKTLHFVS
jgi:hypothetical protein